MKLYIVVEWKYREIPARWSTLHFYLDKDKAEAKKQELEAANTDPVEEDDYGPYAGTGYSIWERDIDT